MTADVAIVGGGASGVLAALHLLRASTRPLRVVLIEKGERLGAGVAYGTLRPEHLLNLTAPVMSAFADDPLHFVRYLREHSATDVPPDAFDGTFEKRRRFGTYLRATLAEARKSSPATLDVVHAEVVDLRESDGFTLRLRSGVEIGARVVILALGNWSRDLPLVGDTQALEAAVLSGWDHPAVARIPTNESVVIAGSGLSMVDTVLTLLANEHQGPIHVVSRHALMPLSHATRGTTNLDVAALLALPLRERIELVRAHARQTEERGEPWQWVMERLRPLVSELWRTLSLPEQRRFLRHMARYWDVHRHRLPREVAVAVGTLFESGRIAQHSGRVTSIAAHGNRVKVSLGGTKTHGEPIIADYIVNCIGMQTNMLRIPDALVRDLLGSGFAGPGPHGIGFGTDSTGAVLDSQRRPQPRLFTLGSVRVGQLWESVAVPELRSQADQIARHICTHLAVESR